MKRERPKLRQAELIAVAGACALPPLLRVLPATDAWLIGAGFAVLVISPIVRSAIRSPPARLAIIASSLAAFAWLTWFIYQY